MGKIINLHGLDHKCGTTMLCSCMAEMCVRIYPDKKVLLFNPCRESEYYFSSADSLSNLSIYDLHSAIKDTVNVSPETIIDQLNTERKLYDYIFCDSGTGLRKPEILGCLYSADINIFVIEQSSIALRRAKEKQSKYRSAGIPVENIVINKYASDKLIREEIILRELDIERKGLFKVKNSKWSEFADEEKKCLLHYKDKTFTKELEDIWQSLMLRGI